MNEHAPTTRRVRHPTWLIVLLGGCMGSAINLGITLLLHATVVSSPYIAFFIGSLANQAFHFVYYKLVLIQVRDADNRSPLLRTVEYVGLSLIAVGFLWIALAVLHLSLIAGVILSLAVLSTFHLLLVRMASFASPQIAMIEYTNMHESFYEEQVTEKVNVIRAWFHRSRFQRLHDFVHEFYRPGMAVADLGCGNCMWNTDHLPVTGVDINQSMMDWAKRHNQLTDYHVRADLSNTSLPDKSYDIIIMSETLEHLVDFEAVIREVRRILKDDGVFLITVPYDYFFGPFFVLFNVNCLYQGFVRGSKYHRVRCGHVNHFNKKRLDAKLTENGWRANEIRVINAMTLYVVARKTTESAGATADARSRG